MYLSKRLVMGLMNDWRYGSSTLYEVLSTSNENRTLNLTTEVNGPAVDEITHWYAVLCWPIIISAIIGNCMVCTAVLSHKQLQTSRNFFLVSLSLTDTLVALLVMPVAMLTEIQGKFPFSSTICILWSGLDVLLCTSSIWHMCAISVDRYLAIRLPFRHGRDHKKRLVVFKIVASWLLSITVTLPLIIMSTSATQDVYSDGICAPRSKNFILYGSIIAFYLPLIVMSIMYVKTIKMLRNNKCLLREAYRNVPLAARKDSIWINLVLSAKRSIQAHATKGSMVMPMPITMDLPNRHGRLIPIPSLQMSDEEEETTHSSASKEQVISAITMHLPAENQSRSYSKPRKLFGGRDQSSPRSRKKHNKVSMRRRSYSYHSFHPTYKVFRNSFPKVSRKLKTAMRNAEIGSSHSPSSDFRRATHDGVIKQDSIDTLMTDISSTDGETELETRRLSDNASSLQLSRIASNTSVSSWSQCSTISALELLRRADKIVELRQGPLAVSRLRSPSVSVATSPMSSPQTPNSVASSYHIAALYSGPFPTVESALSAMSQSVLDGIITSSSSEQSISLPDESDTPPPPTPPPPAPPEPVQMSQSPSLELDMETEFSYDEGDDRHLCSTGKRQLMLRFLRDAKQHFACSVQNFSTCYVKEGYRNTVSAPNSCIDLPNSPGQTIKQENTINDGSTFKVWIIYTRLHVQVQYTTDGKNTSMVRQVVVVHMVHTEILVSFQLRTTPSWQTEETWDYEEQLSATMLEMGLLAAMDDQDYCSTFTAGKGDFSSSDASDVFSSMTTPTVRRSADLSASRTLQEASESDMLLAEVKPTRAKPQPPTTLSIQPPCKMAMITQDISKLRQKTVSVPTINIMTTSPPSTPSKDRHQIQRDMLPNPRVILVGNIPQSMSLTVPETANTTPIGSPRGSVMSGKPSSLLLPKIGIGTPRTSSVSDSYWTATETMSGPLDSRGNLARQMRIKRRSVARQYHHERKAAKVLIVMFTAFSISWTPFFLHNIIYVACPECTEAFPSLVLPIVNWLGWSSSVINPIIYTIFSTRFRRAFSDMLRGRCRTNLARGGVSHSGAGNRSRMNSVRANSRVL